MKPLVVTILTPINGSQYKKCCMKFFTLFFFLLIAVFSCKPYHPLSRYSYLNGNTLYNDSINLKIDFFGDIKFNQLSRVEIKKRIKGLNLISPRKLLLSGTANVSPEYDVLLFYETLKNKTNDSSGIIEIVHKDTIKNRILYKKNKGSKSIFVFLKTKNNNKKINSIIKDGKSITESISFKTNFEELTYSKVFETYKNNTNYLLVREKIKNAPVDNKDKNEWMQFQFLTTINSFIANNKEYDSLINKFQDSRKKYLSPILDTLLHNTKLIKGDSVIEKIAALSEHTRVIMLNENHWYPKHRMLAIKLLKPLKNAGYTHLALEALYKNQDSILNNIRPYVKMNSGFYTRDPIFAHFIREAKLLGFTILGYENFNDDINRELGEAQNLKNILNNNSNKVFVYAGLSHINEKETSKGKRMAAYFKELSGIDPLTINQVDVISDTIKDLVLIPSYFFENDTKLNKPIDFFVVNNLKTDIQILYPEKELKKILINNNILKKYKNKELLISLYNKNEYVNDKYGNIPITSIIERVSFDGKINLILPTGNFVLKISSIEDTDLIIEELNI